MGEVREELYRIMHGYSALMREHPNKGESQWYYLDPRGANSIDEMKQIDVTNENEPNPYLKEIIEDDMKNNPQDYYVWHTMKDEKVRSSHAIRDGKIYNWNLPPEGGHPGEAYNCRCYAEPYEREKENIDYSLYGKDFSREFIRQMEEDEEFKKILKEYIIPNEGGYSDRSNDRGGKTKFGISQKAYCSEDIKKMTRERANAIIYRDFYMWNGLYKLPYSIRGFVVDYGMPTSPLNAIRTVHKVLGLSSKGNVICPETLRQMKNFSKQDFEDFLFKYKQEMYKYYYDLVEKDNSQKENLKGWLNRADRAHLAK